MRWSYAKTHDFAFLDGSGRWRGKREWPRLPLRVARRGGLLGCCPHVWASRVGRACDSPRAIPTLRAGRLAAGSRRYSWVDERSRAGYPYEAVCGHPSAPRLHSDPTKKQAPREEAPVPGHESLYAASTLTSVGGVSADKASPSNSAGPMAFCFLRALW